MFTPSQALKASRQRIWIRCVPLQASLLLCSQLWLSPGLLALLIGLQRYLLGVSTLTAMLHMGCNTTHQ